MARCALLVLFACSLILGHGSRACANERRLNDLCTRYANGVVSALEDLNEPETLRWTSADMKLWSDLCETLWQYAAYVGRTHPERAQAAIGNIRQHAEKLAHAERKNGYRQVAYAWADMAGCRARRAAGSKAAEPTWGPSADRLVEFGGDAIPVLVMAMTSYAEAAGAPKADADALLAKGRAVRDKVIGLVGDEESKQIIHAGWHADVAKSFLHARKKGPAKKCVAAGLAHLEKGLARSRATKRILDAHYELAVVNAVGKLRVKEAEVRMRTVNAPSVGLELDIPHGACWRVEDADGLAFKCTERFLRGPIRRTYMLKAWSQDGVLTLPDGTRVPSSDVKKLAAATSEGFDAHYDLSKIEDVSKPKRVRLHRSLSDTHRITAEGTMQDTGRWARIHVYFFRSKDTKRTYELTIYEYEKNPPPSPVSDAVLDSLRVR